MTVEDMRQRRAALEAKIRELAALAEQFDALVIGLCDEAKALDAQIVVAEAERILERHEQQKA